MRTYEVGVSKEIAAGPQFIYNLLCDYIGGHPRILPGRYFEHVEVEQGGVGEGTVIKVRMNFLGARSQMRLNITEPSPGEILQEEDLDNGMITQFQIRPLHPPKSLVTIQTMWKQKKGIKGQLEKWLNPIAARKIYMEELELINNYCLEYEKRKIF